MPLVPFFSDLYPLPQLVAPQPLVDTLCPTCEGSSYVETSDDSAALCGDCGGAGHLFVCPKCGLEPAADTDLCGCTPMCENCGNHPSVTDNICALCWTAVERRIREEGDPNLQAWEELKARDMTPAEVAEQMREAQAWGWI